MTDKELREYAGRCSKLLACAKCPDRGAGSAIDTHGNVRPGGPVSPAAQRLLALLAEGYLAEFEDLGGYDGRDAKLRKTMKFDGDLHAATMELRNGGLVGFAANGSGTAWINDKGRAELLGVFTDSQRLDWLSQQEGNLFSPKVDNAGAWAWYGNDGRGLVRPDLRALIDEFLSQGNPE